eukprot:TRINITY_DN1101_c0_g2_i2.p1 TRINITY_DN1101_c0_g2~~TRINITY_DN1101_c0_g2_i2.p1  ORF type:complete len:175 (-),score=19.13 TRINITY_DN1101_c0_g2_i2:406-930(-)
MAGEACSNLLEQIKVVTGASLTHARNCSSPSLIFYCRDEEANALIQYLGIGQFLVSGRSRKRARDPRGKKWGLSYAIPREPFVQRLFGVVERAWLASNTGEVIEVPFDSHDGIWRVSLPEFAIQQRLRAKIVVGGKGTLGTPRIIHYPSVFADGYGDLELHYSISVVVNGVPRV